MENKSFFVSEEGVVQGDIISPLIGNFMLDGLENIVFSSIKTITTSKKLIREFRQSSGKSVRFQLKLVFVRYADNFVVLAASKHLIEKYVRPAIEEFLRLRGVQLAPGKTKILCLKHQNLHFLGYTFQYKKKWCGGNKNLFNFNTNRSGIAMYPQRKKLVLVCRKLRKIFHHSTHRAAGLVISEVNPIIRR